MRQSFLQHAANRRRRYRGSMLLASVWSRLARVLLVVAMLWGLGGWALGWWGT